MNLATLAIASPGSSLWVGFLDRLRTAQSGAGGVELAEPTRIAGIDYCATCGAENVQLRKGQCGECQ